MTTASLVVIPHEKLIDLAASLFESAGIGVEESRDVATSLVESNLCGHESHGVVRVIEYLDLLKRGELHGDVPLEVLTETPALAVCDGGFGFGQVQMRRLLTLASQKARDVGVACLTMRNCGHVGRLGEWVERLARDGLAAQLTVNDNGVLKCVAPPGGTEPCISTNPIALAVPTDSEPLVLDLSTSVVANGKIRVAQISGEDCPDGSMPTDSRPTIPIRALPIRPARFFQWAATRASGSDCCSTCLSRACPVDTVLRLRSGPLSATMCCWSSLTPSDFWGLLRCGLKCGS